MTDDRDDLAASDRALLARGRPPRAMTDAERTALLARARTLAAVPVGFAVYLGFIAKAAAAVAILGAAAVYVASRPSPTPPSVQRPVARHPHPAPAHSRAAPEPPSLPPPPLPAPPANAQPITPRRIPRARPAPPAVTAREPAPAPDPVAPPEVPSTTPSLARERELIDRARQSLQTTPEAAQRALDDHAREAPRGVFAAEREYLRVRLLCAQGRRDEARTHLDALAAIAPASVYVTRARRIVDATIP